MDYKAQIGLGLAALIIVGVACFFWGRSSVSVEVREVIRTEIVPLPPVELKYVGQASLSDVQLKSIPIHVIRRTETILPPVDSSVRVAQFDSLYEDSTKISIDYYYPPLNLFNVDFSYPKNQTTIYSTETKVITKYNWFNHGIVLGMGYVPLAKRFDGFIGYGVTLSLHNLFKN
jgi:hypothetical protein